MIDNFVSQPLTKVDCHYLDHFFKEKQPNELSLDLTKVHGLLTAVISAPTLIKPNEWTAMLLGEEPKFETLFEAEKVMGLIIRLYSQITRQLRGEAPLQLLLWDGQQSQDITTCSEHLLASWCEGYLQGTMLDPLWGTDESAMAMLIPFAVLAKQQCQVNTGVQQSISVTDETEFIANYRIHLLEFVQDNYAYWYQEREAEVKHLKVVNKKRHVLMANCACGSGLSFEKCCYEASATLH